MSQYQLLKDAYFGTGGFENGGYLEKHKRESDQDFEYRRKNAYYLNYVMPIVNALVDPVFKRPPLRDYEGGADAAVEEFLKDVDGNGTKIGAFMKLAASTAKLYGVAFIVVDMPQHISARNLDEMLKMRQFPYVYLMKPEEVKEYGIDKNGNLLYIDFQEIESIKDGAITYRYTHYDREGWRIFGDNVQEATGTYNLGVVPVVPLFSRNLEQKTMLPSPEMLPVAKVAKALYNHCSWLGEILRNQTFPLLTIPSLDAKELVIGNNNALGYSPDSTHEPAFIAPPSDPANILQSQISMLVQEMYRMSSLSFMLSTPSSQNTSGISRQWEFERTNQQLANFAHQCARAEEQAMQIFAGWLNSEIEYTVSYPDDFGIVDLTAEIQNAQAVLDLNLTDGLREEVLKKVLAAYCPDIPDERFDELLKQMEKERQDQLHAEPPEPPVPPNEDGNNEEDQNEDDEEQ